MSDEPKTREWKGPPPAYVTRNNIARVEDLIVSGYAWDKILDILADEGRTESASTAHAWRNEVNRRWASEEQELRPARKDMMRARLEKLYLTAYKHATDESKSAVARSMALAECTKIAKLSIALDGLAAPIAVRHEGVLDPASMTPAEREAEIKTLLAKREDQLRKGSGQGN